ncbi:PilZ domain-containing protein [Neobacillus sp. D3-1R]|uniref:PilZ domain-containing protein n=1 Tax=Neobacillus sp. D3-1R TaxID=3445778 RepID=UPI003FA09567
MIYKREEPFRFHFQAPISASLKIFKINDHRKESSQGLAQVLDVSPNGLRIKTLYDLPVNEKKFLIEISFRINDKPIRILGNLVWKKQEGSSFIYGLIGREDSETKNEVIEELKEFTKRIKRK